MRGGQVRRRLLAADDQLVGDASFQVAGASSTTTASGYGVLRISVGQAKVVQVSTYRPMCQAKGQAGSAAEKTA